MTGLPLVNSSNFDRLVIQNQRLVMLIFEASWSAPSQEVIQIATDLGGEYPGKIFLARISTEADPVIARRLGVNTLPYTVFLYDGQKVGSIEGLHMTEVYRLAIDSLISNRDRHGCPPEE